MVELLMETRIDLTPVINLYQYTYLLIGVSGKNYYIAITLFKFSKIFTKKKDYKMNTNNKTLHPLAVLLILIFTTNILALPPINPIGKNVPITGDISQLKYFFDSLEKTKSEKVRIAHYGDSIIWGDIITDNLRVVMQNKYGGHGIGFLSICNDDLSARKTIEHEFSSDWDWAAVFTKNREHYPIGIAGTVAKASSNSSVFYGANGTSKATDSFSEISLFYSNANSNSSMKYKTDKSNSSTVKLTSGNGLKSTKVDFKLNAKNIDLEFENSNGAFFYGITLDSGNGIYIDNFPFRGNSGVSMRDLDKDLLSDFSKELNYKLFILQFGVNVAASGNVNYKWYSHKMLAAIKNIKEKFPNSSILIISPGDLGKKKGKRMVTHPEIQKFVKVQEEIADKGKVAFWNMFEAMGGENSISDWVDASPPLAFKDYCHLTWDGGEVIADKLINALFDAKSKIK
jgi:hypothetical protein